MLLGGETMKIIHCADLHLDSKMESNLDPQKAKLRRSELLDTYDAMVAYAVAHQIHVIMIAGDLFDKPHIRKTAQTRVLEQMYEHPEIDFLYLKGNHDRSDFLSDMEEDEYPENLKLFLGEHWTSYHYDDVVITGLELTSNNSKTLAMNLVLDQMKCNIVMLHGQESLYEGKDKAEVINLTELKNKSIDYLALGHIHGYKLERLDERGVYCYSGCLEGRGFDECGSKGFVLLDVEDGNVSSEFIPFSSRSFHEVEVAIDNGMSMPRIIEAVDEATREIPTTDLVKLILVGKTDMDTDLDLERIVRSYRERFFYVKVYDRTQMIIDYDSFANDRSLKGEFVRLMQQQDMAEEKRSQIIELGIKAIMGEEVEE